MPARRRLMFSYFARSAGIDASSPPRPGARRARASFAPSRGRAAARARASSALRRDLALGERVRLRRRAPSGAPRPAPASAFSCSVCVVVRLLRDVDLAREGGVLARRLDLAEPALPLLHLVALHAEQRLELAPLALVRRRAAPCRRRTPGGASATAASICGRVGRGWPRASARTLVRLEVDLLQLLQRLQLLTQRRQGSSSARLGDGQLGPPGFEPGSNRL